MVPSLNIFMCKYLIPNSYSNSAVEIIPKVDLGLITNLENRFSYLPMERRIIKYVLPPSTDGQSSIGVTQALGSFGLSRQAHPDDHWFQDHPKNLIRQIVDVHMILQQIVNQQSTLDLLCDYFDGIFS